MKKTIALVVFCSLASAANADPSALVALTQARTARMAPQVSAYGMVGADPNFVTTVFMPRDAVVSSLLVRPGESVTAGEALVVIRSAPAADATYEQAVTGADFAAKDYDHTKQLFAEQLATRSQLAAAAKANSDAQAQLSAQRRIGANQAVETLRAPVAGIIATLVPAKGDPVQPGADVATIATNGRMVLNLGVEPGQAVRLRAGNAVAIDPQQGMPGLTAKIASVGAMVDPASHLVNVLVALPPNAPVLMGTALKARIALSAMSGIVVPSAALLTDGPDSYVFVAQGGKAHRRTVQVAFDDGRQAMIASGLKPGEQVVSEGMVGLDDGMAVRTGE